MSLDDQIARVKRWREAHEEHGIRLLMPVLAKLSYVCAKLDLKPPVLRFSDQDRSRLEFLLQTDMDYYAQAMMFSDLASPDRREAIRRVQAHGVTLEWNNCAARIAQFRQGMDEAMAAYVKESEK